MQNGFPGGARGKESPSNVGDARDMGLIPLLGRSCGGENGNLLHILVCEIPWTEDLCRLQPMGLQGVGQE